MQILSIRVMRRIIVTIVTLVLAASAAFGQDIKQATETYNNGAVALQSGDNAAALEYFRQALSIAQTLGKDGEDIVANCKEYIPKLVFSIAKDLIRAGEWDKAVAQLDETQKVAAEFGDEGTIAEAKDLIPQVYMQKGTAMLNAKKYAEAAEAYKTVLDGDATNGMAALRLGMALTGAGDIDGAIAAYKQASENGQEKTASKQIATIKLKQAAAALKAKNFADAVAAAVESNSYMESAQAYQIAGQASHQLKKESDAITYFEKYLEIKPDAKNAAQIAFTVGALYQQAKNNAKAVEYYQKAVSDPVLGADAAKLVASLKK